jgi:hypothetical protein
VRKGTVWMAVLGLGTLSAGTAHAQGTTLISPDIKEGTTIAVDQVFTALAAPAPIFRPN